MSQFRAAVEKLVKSQMSGITNTTRGVIPQGAFDKLHWVATVVRIANPHGGIHPVGGQEPPYIELHNVPLPFNGGAIFNAIADLFQDADRGVVVGFQGGSLHFPYIVSFLSDVQTNTDKGVPNRRAIAESKLAAGKSSPKFAPISNVSPNLQGEAAKQAVANANAAIHKAAPAVDISELNRGDAAQKAVTLVVPALGISPSNQGEKSVAATAPAVSLSTLNTTQNQVPINLSLEGIRELLTRNQQDETKNAIEAITNAVNFYYAKVK